MPTLRFPLYLVVLTVVTTPLLTAQQLPEGLTATTTALPAGTAPVLETGAGTAYFDGSDLMLAPTGQPPRVLLGLAGLAFGSFLIDAGPNHLLFGESYSGDVWLVPLTGTPPAQPLVNLTLNYDAVMLDASHALVSAKTGGFAVPDNDVVLVDLATGATQTIARFPGASGPLVLDANGDLYYATASAFFPAPAGASTILRLDQASLSFAIANLLVLGTANAQVVLSGLDAAGDLAFDDDGDLFFTDYVNLQVGQVHAATSPQPTLVAALVDYGGAAVSPSSLQFVPAATPVLGSFEPFQPTGGRLLVHETDFVSVSALRAVTSRRPHLDSNILGPIPAGSFLLTASHGPANGIGLLAFAPAAPSGEIGVAVPGFRQTLAWDLALTGTPVLVPVLCDAGGQTSLAITNPGFGLPFAATVQVALVSIAGVIGSSAALGLQISL